MRSQKKRKARFTKKKRDSNAGQLPLTLNLLKWWSDSVYFEADSDDEVRSVGKGGKSKKKKGIASGTSPSTLSLYSSEWSKQSDDSDDEIPPVDLTIFVYVEKPNPPRTAKGKVEESDRYAQKGPFKLSSNDSYATFLRKVSTALPCPILHIIEEKISWKPQTPQNAKPLPMGAATGYSTMIDALKVKRVGARVGIVIMPPPKKPDEDTVNMSHICFLSALTLFIQFWDADGSGKAIEKGFDFSELEFRSTGDSIVQQKVRSKNSFRRQYPHCYSRSALIRQLLQSFRN